MSNKPSQKALELADTLCNKGVLLSGSLCEPERSEIAHVIDRVMNARGRTLDEAFTTLADALDEKADWLEPAFWDATPETMDKLHAALARFQERGGTK